jgi:hypothetical protein
MSHRSSLAQDLERVGMISMTLLPQYDEIQINEEWKDG